MSQTRKTDDLALKLSILPPSYFFPGSFGAILPVGSGGESKKVEQKKILLPKQRNRVPNDLAQQKQRIVHVGKLYRKTVLFVQSFGGNVTRGFCKKKRESGSKPGRRKLTN